MLTVRGIFRLTAYQYCYIIGSNGRRQEAPMPIPDFCPDGYLPLGVLLATEEEVAQRLGKATERRRALMGRISVWLALARALGAQRLLLDGSFVTAKPEPGDVDAVCWLPSHFEDQYLAQVPEAVRLYEMLATRSPAELFGVF